MTPAVWSNDWQSRRRDWKPFPARDAPGYPWPKQGSKPEFHLIPGQPESPREILKRYALALMENARNAAGNGDEYEISEELLEMMGVMEENGAAVSN